jgi:hypothetical protein
MDLRALHRHGDQAQHGGVQAVGLAGQFGVLAVDGQRILRQIVGADREEIGMGGQRMRDHGGGGHLDHDADGHMGASSSARMVSQRSRSASSSGTEVIIGNMIDRSPPAPPRGTARAIADRADRAGAAAARAAHAEEGVLLLGQVEMRHLLVAADVQRAHDQRPVAQGLDHAAIDGELFVLGRCVARFEEQEFGAHQAHALAALRQRKGA